MIGRKSVKKQTEKERKDKHNTSMIFKLIWRFTMFLTLAVLATFALYISGNYQEFLDSSQRFILQWCSILTIILALFSVSGFFLSIVMAIVYKKVRYLLFLVIYLIILALSVVLFLVMYGITYLSVGL
ncbi:MAG: hypothetical protein J6Y60_04715 [Treponema sp.]|nr:hypothetical protein [Treponema sp.]